MPDVLVNNAGFSTVGPVAEVDPGREIQMLRTNVEAVDHLCALVAPGMVERRRGAILNVASTASYQPLPGQAGYAASKAFVRSFTTSLAGELAPFGITVTALCPGPVRTEFGHTSGMDDFTDGNPLPEVMWVEVEDVARIAVDALDDGRLVSIPGPVNRLGAAIANVVPRQVLVPLLARAHPHCHDRPRRRRRPGRARPAPGRHRPHRRHRHHHPGQRHAGRARRAAPRPGRRAQPVRLRRRRPRALRRDVRLRHRLPGADGARGRQLPPCRRAAAQQRALGAQPPRRTRRRGDGVHVRTGGDHERAVRGADHHRRGRARRHHPRAAGGHAGCQPVPVARLLAGARRRRPPRGR